MNQATLAHEVPPIAASAINRRLAAIAFADVAGFSRLMALNDVETVRRWKALRTQVMEPHMIRHGGRLVDLAGDGMAQAPGVRRGDHEEIEQGGRPAEVEKHDVPGPVVIRNPGRDPGMCEREVDPLRVAPIDGLCRYVILRGLDRSAADGF